MLLGQIMKTRPTSTMLPVFVFLGIIFLILVVITIKTLAPVEFKFAVSYTEQILEMIYEDEDRAKAADYLSWVQEFKLHEMEMKFYQNTCEENILKGNKQYTWLTAMMNDNYAIGAVYLAYILKKLSCSHNMISLATNGVSQSSIDAMRKVGFDVRVLEPLDCNWMDRKKGIPVRHIGLPGTHMRFYAWNYTEYKKIIYLDPDVMPLNSIDELFTKDGELMASYCSRPGIVDPCFNAGLLVFEPSHKSYNEIMDLWSSLSRGSACPNDQVLLWHYYADQGRWTSLPYAYNVRRYLYHPMKVYHYACCLTKKPWQVEEKPSREQCLAFKGPLVEPEDVIVLWWKYFYEALDEYSLHGWYDGIKYTI